MKKGGVSGTSHSGLSWRATILSENNFRTMEACDLQGWKGFEIYRESGFSFLIPPGKCEISDCCQGCGDESSLCLQFRLTQSLLTYLSKQDKEKEENADKDSESPDCSEQSSPDQGQQNQVGSDEQGVDNEPGEGNQKSEDEKFSKSDDLKKPDDSENFKSEEEKGSDSPTKKNITSSGEGNQLNFQEIHTDDESSPASPETEFADVPTTKSAENPTGADSEAGENSENAGISESSTWESFEEPSDEDSHSYGGGGGQLSSAKITSEKSERQVQYLLRQFFSEIETLSQKEQGFKKWDAKKIVKSAICAPQNLPVSKFQRPKSRQTCLLVDTSGSVSYLTDFISRIISTAIIDNDVEVVTGSEAHPEEITKSGKIIWTQEYEKDFATNLRFYLKNRKISPGATIIVWSDYMDIHADTQKLKTVLAGYKVVWLCSHAKDYDDSYTGNESIKLENFSKMNGHEYLWGIDSPEGIRQAIKKRRVKNG